MRTGAALTMDDLHSFLARGLDKKSECPAIMSEIDGPVSLGELSIAVRDFEDCLGCAGVAPRQLVAVSGLSEWRWIAAMLAIWRMGAVYMPRPDALSMSSVPSGWMIDCRTPGRVEAVGEAPVRLPYTAAYVLPTSGTTGVAKLVVGTLDGLSNFMSWECRALNITAKDVFSQLTPPTFDPVFREVLPPLLTGARLAVPSAREATADPRLLQPWLAEIGVTIVHAVPTLVRTWRLSPRPIPSLRCLVLAGEPLFASDVEVLRAQFPQSIRIFNLYGPTETTLAACAYECPVPMLSTELPVGKAIDGYAWAVLADNHRICAPYEVGEVYIKARRPSLGYLSSDGAVKSPFVVDPLAEGSLSAAVFRSGDTGYANDRGELVLVGRVDGRVKIHGAQVDASSIENELRQVAGVESVAVRVLQDDGNAPTLVAYLVTRRPLAEVKRDAMKRLARTAWPQSWVMVDVIPTTTSGKADKNRLPPVVRPSVDASSSNLVLLQSLWRTYLSHDEELTPDTSFFALGGKSIEAVQLLLEVEERTGVQVSLEEFFQNPTIVEMAALLETSKRVAGPAHLALIRSSEPPQLTGAQERFWNWMQRPFGDAKRFQFLSAIRLRGNLDAARLRRALGQVINECDGLRMNITLREDRVVQEEFNWGGDVPVFDVSAAAAPLGEAFSIATTESDRSYQFGVDALMRPSLFVLGKHDHIVAFDNHVLGSDGWTKRLIIGCVARNYRGVPQGPVMSWLDVARDEVNERSREWERYLPFWRERLARLRPSGLRMRHAETWTSNLSTISDTIEISAQLVSAAGRLDVTVASLYIGALSAALADVTAQATGHILLSHANRRRREHNEVIGCFTDSMVFEYDVQAQAVAHAVATNRSCLAALQNAVPSFTWLMDTVRPDIDPYLPASFPVIFAPQTNYATFMHIDGVDAEELSWGHKRWIWPLEVYPLLDTVPHRLIVNFADDMFERADVERLVAGMRNWLSELVSAALS